MSEQTNTDMSKHFYRASAADFMKIPGSPVAYWVPGVTRDAFANGTAFREIASPKVGMQTSNNSLFLRLWHEISFNEFINVNSESPKWIKYVKGGPFRRWYGNLDYLLRYNGNGKEILMQKNGSILPKSYLFKPKGTWTDLTSGKFSSRVAPDDSFHDISGHCFYPKQSDLNWLLGYSNSCVFNYFISIINSSFHFQVGDVGKMPILDFDKCWLSSSVARLIELSKLDWDSQETSWDFSELPLLNNDNRNRLLENVFSEFVTHSQNLVAEVIGLEESVNSFFIDAYKLTGELSEKVPEHEVTLNCNPAYRFGRKRSQNELISLYRGEMLLSLLSYGIGCMMGRYSPDKPGLILASQGETIQDYLAQVPSPKFMPDDDAILPLTDQEWFADDVTNRFREFVKVVWGEETLQENLDFVAESLYLHAIKPKKGETSMEAIRRYLSTQFYKDHMKTYKKRPIYWLFSSGKQKAFECLVYLHRYNEGTLSRMRTEYVTPLMGKYESQIRHIEEQQASASAGEKTKLEKELKDYQSKLNELREFDSKLKHYADMRISLDLDDGVKVNYGKFGDLLANVKDITGEKPKLD